MGFRSAAFHNIRATVAVGILLGGIPGWSCDGLTEYRNPYQLPGRGLSRAPADQSNAADLLWTINAGVLNDSVFPELSVADVEPVLHGASRDLAALLPGLELRFIIDQPMNAVFLMERGLERAKDEDFVTARLEEDGPVLLLSSGEIVSATNTLKMQAAGLSAEERLRRQNDLTALHALVPTGSGAGRCLDDRLPASDALWRAYLGAQVRYDLILTNALVYADDLRRTPQDAERGALPHVIVRRLVRTPGRSAVEGTGAYVSWNESLLSGSGVACQAGGAADVRSELQTERARAAVLPVLFAMIYPASLTAVVAAGGPQAFLQRCGAECDTYWSQRLAYLRAIVDAEAGGGAEACARLEESYPAYESAVLPPLSEERAADLARNHGLFRRLCGKK